jgi:glycosyltransferase involved in cell wall biosynthesis
MTIDALKGSIKKTTHINKWEIIVVDNNSSDSTASIAKAKGAVVVHEPIRQIAKARNTGANHAHGDFLFFVDADTILRPEHTRQAVNALLSEDVFGGGALVKFDNHKNKFFLGIFIPFLWNWLSKTFRLAAGSFIFCRKEDFISSGGFPETMYAGEELVFVRNLKRLKRKSRQKFLIITDPPVITSSRKLDWHGNWQMAFYLLMLFVFPFAVRFRKLCWFWYKRP